MEKDELSEEQQDLLDGVLRDHEWFVGTFAKAMRDDGVFHNPEMRRYFFDCFLPQYDETTEKLRRFLELVAEEGAPVPNNIVTMFTEQERTVLGRPTFGVGHLNRE